MARHCLLSPRTGLFDPEVVNGGSTVSLSRGQKILLVTDPEMFSKGTASQIFVDHPQLVHCLEPGNTVFVDDGLISLKASMCM